jgi:PAS domain S-box-containing protein
MDLDYKLAFELAPVGMALSRHRIIVDCNHSLCEMFGVARQDLLNQSFQLLYPSAVEYERTGERIAPLLNHHGTYTDDRIMKRVGGRFKGETFWCHVNGRALNPQTPHEAGIWTFEDLSARGPVKAELTAREREVATHLMRGLSSKEIAKALNISHRTVEIHRANLLRKYRAANTGELVLRLVSGQA